MEAPFSQVPFTQPGLVPNPWSSSSSWARQRLTPAVPWLVAGCRSRWPARKAEGCRVVGRGRSSTGNGGEGRDLVPRGMLSPACPSPACLPTLGQGCPACWIPACFFFFCSCLCRDGRRYPTPALPQDTAHDLREEGRELGGTGGCCLFSHQPGFWLCTGSCSACSPALLAASSRTHGAGPNAQLAA